MKRIRAVGHTGNTPRQGFDWLGAFLFITMIVLGIVLLAALFPVKWSGT